MALNSRFTLAVSLLLVATAAATNAPAQAGSARASAPPVVVEGGGHPTQLEFNWLPTGERSAARRSLAEYDAKVAAAMSAADRAFRAGGPGAQPVRPVLPASPRLPGTQVTPPATPSLQPPQATVTAGYQSDHLFLADHPDDVFASDYQVWLDISQEGLGSDQNACDNVVSPVGCFWFYAIQHSMNNGVAGFHIGPQRGNSLAGNAGPNWRMNIDGYNGANSTNHVGGQSTVNLPVQTWIRVRTWRTSVTATTATFTVFAMWNNVEHELRPQLTINGTAVSNSLMFAEVNENDLNGQCVTDVQRTLFLTPQVWRGDRAFTFPTATTNYEANCANTTWRSLGGSPDFVSDERETARVVPQGALMWDRTRLDYNWNALPHTRSGSDLRVVLRPRGWLTQPFVAGKPMFDHVSFVAGCGSCIVDIHIYANREVTQHVCSQNGVRVNENVFTTVYPDWCFFTPGRYYYLQIYNTSFTNDATMYLVDAAGGNPSDFAYVANAGTLPGSTALRSLIYTRDQ